MSIKKSIGVIINPIAGLGGKIALKGSDMPDILEKSLALGNNPESEIRAGYALEKLIDIKDTFDIYTYGKNMGENKLKELGFEFEVLGFPKELQPTAEDTINAAKLMKEKKVDLILFAGGDGTARNICEAINTCIPVIGIPTGVKIHSAVYAINPLNAGIAAKEYLTSGRNQLREREVMDIDEDLFRQGIVSSKLYGYMIVPESKGRIQNMKSGGRSESGDLAGMAGYVVCKMEKDTIYIVGPGSNTKSIMDDLNLPCTLLGVDVIRNKQLIASDVTESELIEIINNTTENVKIIVTIIGGQGILFGRGNQQIGPQIIRSVGKENIIVVSTPQKLIGLKGTPLIVDTGDLNLDEELCGFMEIIIGFNQTSYCKITS